MSEKGNALVLITIVAFVIGVIVMYNGVAVMWANVGLR